MNFKNGKLNLSVNSQGVVSLWDTYKQAANVHEEVTVVLELTLEQRVQLFEATLLAVEKQALDDSINEEVERRRRDGQTR